MEDISKYNESIFEGIKHVNEYGQEFWYARELQDALEYSQWRRFNQAIERAMDACEAAGNEVSEHFANAGKTSVMPNGGERTIQDYQVGAKVRQTIKELGGTMPEDLPTPDRSIQQIERKQKKLSGRKEETK